MAIQIRQNQDITGFTVPNSNVCAKILQYADDGVLILKNEFELKKAMYVITEFGKFSGTLLNKSKCEGLWLGRLKYKQDDCKLCDIKWPKEPIRLLGIFIGHNKEENDILNWDKKIEKIEVLLNIWKQRNLTLFGKVVILKQLALPKILFSASVLPIPKNIIKHINTLFYLFIWGMTDRVKRNVLINDVDKGGIRMIDIQSMFDAVKAAWIPRLVNAEEDDLWNMIAKYYLRYNMYDNFILKCNFVCKDSFTWLYDIPPFYQEVLLSFNKAKTIDKDTFYDDIFKQPIWANQFVNISEKNKTKVLYYKSWIDVGIFYIGNLKFIDGKLDEHYVYDKVKNKSNILVEIVMLKEALKPYRQMLGNHEPVHNIHVPIITFRNNEIFRFKNCKSKPFYRNLVTRKVESNTHEVYWKNCLDINDDFFKKC